MIVAAVRTALVAAADPGRAAQEQAYMKSALPYRGPGAPQLKLVLGPLLAEHRFTDREDWESAARELWDSATHREEWYAAIALLRHPAYRAWVDPRLLPLLEHLWVRRSAMLSQLRHKHRTDTDLLHRVLDANLDDTTYGQEFFIRKALGLALRARQDGSGVGPRLPADPRRSVELTVPPGGEQAHL